MIKKIFGWNKYYSTSVNVLLVCHKIFTYFLPLFIFAYCTFLHKVFSGDYTKANKICSSVLVGIVITALLIWHLIGKHFTRKIEMLDGNIKDLTTKALTTEDEEKTQSVENLKNENQVLKKTRRNQAIYKNTNLLIPFIIMLIMVIMIEKAILSMRGVLFLITISMLVGFMFNVIAQIKLAKK